MGNDRQRHDLEWAAFSDDAAPADREAARHELARRGASGTGASESSSNASSPMPAPDPTAAPDTESLLALGSASPRRFSLTALGAMLAVGLVLGGVGAWAFTRGDPGADAPRAVSAEPAPDSSYAVIGKLPSTPKPVIAIAAADALLEKTPVKSDTYPHLFSANDTFEPSTTRLVATAGSAHRIYIARKIGSEKGYCLLTADLDSSGAMSSGSASCSSADDFAAQGMFLGEDAFTVTWIAGSITVAIGSQN